MADNEPTVSVPLSTYDKLRDDLREAQKQVYALEKELVAAKLTDASGVGKLLHDAFHETIKVVQFAVGNLDPSTVVGWLHQALVNIADAIEKIPGIDRHVSEMPPELRHFAGVAASMEAFRKERDKHKVVLPASAEDFGPKTPEAAAVHAAYDARRTAPEEKLADGDPAAPTT